MGALLNKNIYLNYIVQVANTGVNFAYSLVIVRHLGAPAYGDYSIFYNAIAFSTLLLGFNLPSIIIFFIANKKLDAWKLLLTSLTVILLASILLLAMLVFSDELHLSRHIFPGAENKGLWIFFFVAMFLLLQVNQALQAYLNALRVFIPIAVFSMLCNIGLLVFWALIAAGFLHITAAPFDIIWWAAIGMNLVVLVYSAVLAIKKTALPLQWKLAGWQELRMIAGFAAIVYVCNTLQFLNYRMDIWFVNYYQGNADSGVYSLSLSLSQLVWVLPNAISGILLNYFSVRHRRYSILTALNYGRLCFYSSLLTTGLLSLIYYTAIPYFYGEAFRQSFTLCMILFAGVIPFSLSIILANLNSGIGFVRLNLYATVFTFVLGAVLDWFMIPSYGIIGAAWVKTGVYTAGLAFQFLAGHFYYQLPWASIFKFPNWQRIIKLK